MSADVVATQCPGCCDAMMAVENVIHAAPGSHLDGRQWVVLAHGDQYAAQAGASTITDRPEVPVEQLRCAVNRPQSSPEPGSMVRRAASGWGDTESPPRSRLGAPVRIVVMASGCTPCAVSAAMAELF